MLAIERVMRAYTSKNKLNREQTVFVRQKLIDFIAELKAGRLTEVATVEIGAGVFRQAPPVTPATGVGQPHVTTLD